MVSAGDPVTEVDVTTELVRSLLEAQHPDLATLPLEVAASGWDNVMVRIGDHLAARLPRRDVAVILIEHERRSLPELAPRLPLPIPVPVRLGEPGDGYPWPWTITPWLPGRPLLHAPPADPHLTARQLGEFVAALRAPAPTDAPPNPYRGVPLAERTEHVARWADELGEAIDSAAVQACWRDHLALPRWAGPPQWLHGDLHLLNVLADGERVTAVIDFGDVTSGDPATDLFIAWMALPPEARPTFRAAADVDDDTWRRARAWALCMGLAYLSNPSPTNQLRPVGRATVEAVLQEWGRE